MKKITLLFNVLLLLFGSFAFAQTYYSENFEGGSLNGWVSSDLDGDSQQWSVLNASGIDSALGNGSMISFSYDDASSAALSPDNLVTSPVINLTSVTASNAVFLYDINTDGEGIEHYAVYVTSTAVASDIIATTPVYETTVIPGGMMNKSIDLSSYIGQNVYVSIRHFNCTNGYYFVIDNIEVKSLLLNNVQLVSSTLNRYGLMNSSNPISLTVKNKGSNIVNNISVTWNDGTTNHTSTIPTSIGVGETITVDHPTAVQYSTVEEKTLNISIDLVNALVDSDLTNNSSSNRFNTISQASLKKVLFEEGTGTWCGWCPRGAVAMNYMTDTYPNEFIGVAVHNGSSDPMKLAAYDTAAGITGFPGMNVDRVVKNESVTQNLMISHLNERKILASPVSLDATGSAVGSVITINASATFRTNFAVANFRLGVIISEDNVHGTGTGYKQTNYYAANANGPMGGFESLANPVPAASMYYNHVGRALVGGYNGQVNSIPATIIDGQVANYTFTYTVPATSTIANMHAVLVLIDQATGEVVNAKSVLLTALLSTDSNVFSKNQVQLYPNPASDFVNIKNLTSGEYTVSIYDLLGKLVQTNEKQNVIENETLTIPVKGLSRGEYIISIANGTTSNNQHLLIK